MKTGMDLAVVLSGGGSRGAFQVGVLDALVRQGGLDVGLYAGISTGAIQALGAAADRIGDLRAVWEDIRGNRDIFKKRFLGLFGAVIGGASSLYDAGPVRDRIRAFHDPEKLRASGRGLLVGAVSLRTGALRYFDEEDANIAEWVIASAAVPATYQPLVDASGDKWVDGGVRDITPLGAVIERRPKAILVILAQNRQLGVSPGNESYDDLIEIGLRAASILTNEVQANDIDNVEQVNDLLAARAQQARVLERVGLPSDQQAAVLAPIDEQIERYRYIPVRVIEPDADFVLPESTEFDPDDIRRLIAHGEEVAGRRSTAELLAVLTPPGGSA